MIKLKFPESEKPIYYMYVGFILYDADFDDYINGIDKNIDINLVMKRLIDNISKENEIVYGQEEFISKIYNYMSTISYDKGKYVFLYSDLTKGIYLFKKEVLY